MGVDGTDGLGATVLVGRLLGHVPSGHGHQSNLLAFFVDSTCICGISKFPVRKKHTYVNRFSISILFVYGIQDLTRYPREAVSLELLGVWGNFCSTR